MNPSKKFFAYMLRNDLINQAISLIEFVKVCQFFTGTIAGSYNDGIDLETAKKLFNAFRSQDWKAVEGMLS
jgi:hypothetical protein